MSFSSKTKKELGKIQWESKHEMHAECYGFLMFAKKFKYNEIVLSTESESVAGRFTTLLTSIFGVIVEKRSTLTGRSGRTHFFTISVPDTKHCNKIFEAFGHLPTDMQLRINRANFETEESVCSFLRGAFLSGGSLSDPAKDYHLEFSVPFKNLCGDLTKLISEVGEYNNVPKIVMRKGSYIAYVKDSEQIAEFLAFIGAPIASMGIMQEKIVKEIRNNTNRKTNSEVANMKKTITASMEQIEAIEIIKNKMGLESLPEELRELALLRLEQPDASLRELGAMLAPSISRSGVNHRIKRIMELAGKL